MEMFCCPHALADSKLVHSDEREDARLLNGVTYAVSVPYK